ncbi:MAG: LamG-like jellyroll fold domain-containing protein, partial [Candidatus Hydrogenedentota bacterium]
MAVGNRDPKRFTDLGAQASDDEDGDLTSSIVITGKVDEGQPGTYTINYRVSDVAGNVTEASRTIQIVEKEKPAVIYVDNKALSKYTQDPYLSLDTFEGHRQNGRGGEDFERYRSGRLTENTVQTGYAKSDPDWIDLGENAPNLNHEFTQEAWVYYDFTHQGMMNIFGPSPFLRLYQNANQASPQIQFGFLGKQYKNNSVNDIISKVGWFHLAVTYDANGDYTLYTNGEEVYRRKNYWEGETPDATPLRFIGRNFHGKIDDVRLWNVARSPAEIRDNMNRTLNGDESGLVAYYPMDFNENWELIDHSPNRNHAKTSTTLKSYLAVEAGVFAGESIHNVEILHRYVVDGQQGGPDGSAEYPYPTIRSALDAVRKMIDRGKHGHRIVIREGRYSEVITLDSLNEDGPEGIVIEGHPGEDVILDGTVEVKVEWNDDDKDGIYQAVLDMDVISSQAMTPIEAIYGVFVDGRYMIPAMPVNMKNPTDPTQGNPPNPEPGTIWSWNKEAKGQAGPDDGRLDWRYGIVKPYWVKPSVGFYFPNDITVPEGVAYPQARKSYVPGDLAHLDAPEEWAFDRTSGTIYLYASDGYIPNETNVRVRVRDRFVNIVNSDRLTLKNIHFFAGSLNFKDADYLTVEDSKFSFSVDMGLVRGNRVSGNFHRLTNSIFEYINDGAAWSITNSANARIENVLFQYNDWFPGTGWQPNAAYIGRDLPEAVWGVAPTNGFNPDVGDESWYAPVWRYVTVRDSYAAGVGAGRGSLVEYSRFENLYDGCDCSGIQRNSFSVIGSTSRYNWIINLPSQNGIRFDSAKGGTFGEIHHIVSVGNRRNLRIKGDYHEVYQTTTYNATSLDIYYTADKYAGFNPSESYSQGSGSVPGNAHSRLLNSTAGNSLTTNVPDFWPSLAYVRGRDEYDESIFEGKKAGVPFLEALQQNPNYLIDQSGIWYGRTMETHPGDTQGLDRPWSDPILELENPWNKSRTESEPKIIERFGFNPFAEEGVYSEDGHFYGVQSYDFRPKKGSSLIDSGVVVPGLNDGGDKGYVPHPDWGKDSGGRDFNHDPSYPGQHRPFVGEAPDIGAYEHGDSVYWIPGFRYSYPSVPIPNDQASDVPLEYGLAWNYPYKKDYSNTEALVSITGPGVNLTETFTYPYNVLFASFEPNSTYTWSVTVDGVSGGTWTFTTSDKIYPVNDRSVDVINPKIVFPSQKPSLEVSTTNVAFLKFDMPETIPGMYKAQLNLIPESISNLGYGVGVYKYANSDWSEINNNKNIGIADHTRGELIHTFRELKEGVRVSLDITDVIDGNSGDFSLALAALGKSDAVSFYSKEQLLDNATAGLPEVVPRYDFLPNISFTKATSNDVIAPNKGNSNAVMVSLGSGGGFYYAGEQVSISATVPEGTKFLKWEGDVSAIADINSQTTMLTVPEDDSEVTAAFRYTVGNVFWTGLAGDLDITNPGNWSNNLNPTESGAWQTSDLGVVALLDNGDGTDSHVITGSSYRWSDADLLLKADTVLKAYNPIFHSGGDITLQDRSFLYAERHFTLGRNNLPSQLIITGNPKVQIGSRLYLYSGSSINQNGGKVALINNMDSGRLHLYNESVYSISAGRLEISAPGNEIRLKNSISSTEGYINFTKDSTGEIYFRDLNLEEIIAHIGSGGIRIDDYDASSHADPASYFLDMYNYNATAKVLRLRNGIVPPTVSGSTAQGETLTVGTDNITTAENVDTFSYQWFRGDAPIAGAVSSTYQLTQEDVGFPISITVAYTDQKNAGQFVTSSPTNAVANINDSPTGSVALNSYFPPQGRMLTADTSSITDIDGLGAFSYQWNRQDSPIAGATASSYTLTQTDVGALISVNVAYTDQQGTVESITSRTTNPVRISSLTTLSDGATLSAESRSYGIGDTLTIKATWGYIVVVDGTPRLKLSNGSEAIYS